MDKKEIVFSELKSHLLSPGNIFWKKNSGQEILVSKKGDLCNLNLIEKIQASKNKILIENEVDRNLILESKELFSSYEKELLVKEKNVWKKRILSFIKNNFIEAECSQFELNLLAWMHFSNLTFEQGSSFLEKDRDYFIRSLTIATNVTYSAIALGYYDIVYLKNLFTNTITSFEKVLDGRSPISLKEKLENYRKSNVSIEEMNTVISLNRENILFEKSSGKGVKSIVPSELSDLEMLLVELNESYTYESNDDSNYFKRVSLRNINIQEKFCKVIESSLGITDVERNAA